MCVCVCVSHAGPVWLWIRLGEGGELWSQGSVHRVQRGVDRGEETEGMKEGNKVDKHISKWVARCLPALSPCRHVLLSPSHSHCFFLRLSAVQTRRKQAAILFANLFHTLVSLQDHCYNWAVIFLFFFFFFNVIVLGIGLKKKKRPKDYTHGRSYPLKLVWKGIF